MEVVTPEVLWHGGGNENGKPDPVFSVDMHPSNVLASAGIDANVPPKGSVRIWKVNSSKSGQEFIIELSDHNSVINACRFSPCGKMLATASDRQIVIYVVSNPSAWASLVDTRSVERHYHQTSLSEIYDIQWSPDSTHIISGAIDCKV